MDSWTFSLFPLQPQGGDAYQPRVQPWSPVGALRVCPYLQLATLAHRTSAVHVP